VKTTEQKEKFVKLIQKTKNIISRQKETKGDIRRHKNNSNIKAGAFN
jgi:hypothetical protein